MYKYVGYFLNFFRTKYIYSNCSNIRRDRRTGESQYWIEVPNQTGFWSVYPPEDASNPM